jgi:5-deoxy-D-glucuronate isomerase
VKPVYSEAKKQTTATGGYVMDQSVIRFPSGFGFGSTSIIDKADKPEVGLDFAIMRLRGGEHRDLGSADDEQALLLIEGEALVHCDQGRVRIARRSIFDEGPSVLHIAARQTAKIECLNDSEFAVIATDNDEAFATQIFVEATMAENEHRGRGLLDDTAYRLVRTVFDKRNRPSSNLVLGEVITFPGRWSSYPPHFHAQPEIYHYRFTEPQGYGHAELGERVFKIRQNDTLTILDKQTHAQVSAPGYGMYYLWAIRHLRGDPYTVPTFVDEHAWTKHEGANERVWR